jgi:hypothetical protein
MNAYAPTCLFCQPRRSPNATCDLCPRNARSSSRAIHSVFVHDRSVRLHPVLQFLEVRAPIPSNRRAASCVMSTKRRNADLDLRTSLGVSAQLTGTWSSDVLWIRCWSALGITWCRRRAPGSCCRRCGRCSSKSRACSRQRGRSTRARAINVGAAGSRGLLARQLEAGNDQPHEARKARQRDEKQGRWNDQAERAQLTDRREHDAQHR